MFTGNACMTESRQCMEYMYKCEVGWSSRRSRVCVTMLALQCRCRFYNGTCLWGAVCGCAGCAVRVCWVCSCVTLAVAGWLHVQVHQRHGLCDATSQHITATHKPDAAQLPLDLTLHYSPRIDTTKPNFRHLAAPLTEKSHAAAVHQDGCDGFC